MFVYNGYAEPIERMQCSHLKQIIARILSEYRRRLKFPQFNPKKKLDAALNTVSN